MKFYKTDLYRVALSYLRNQEDALEAIQAVTYRAYKNIHKVRQKKYLKTWIIRIMINYCNDQLKRKKRFILDNDYIQSRGVIESHLLMEMNDAILQLDERSREIVTLMYFHDLKIKEIAKMMGRSEGTVKTWLHRALTRLREVLEERGDDLHE